MIDLSKTIDLSTTYLGLKLKNPLVASSSPMCKDVANVRRLEGNTLPLTAVKSRPGAEIVLMSFR